MNLELNLESTVNPLIDRFSQPPIEFRGDDIIILKNFMSRNRRVSNLIGEYPLCSIDMFLSSIDEEEFAKVTAMEYTRRFQDKVDEFERHWGRTIRLSTELDYHFETKKNFDWKNGIYDMLKAYTIETIGFNMRNSGVNRLFKRIHDGNRRMHALQTRFDELERLRRDCKNNVGKVVENLEVMVETYQKNFDIVKKETDSANEMSSNYTVYNAINFTDMDADPPYNGFLNLKLFTIVDVKPSSMTIVDDRDNIINELPTPQSYLVFTRPLSKVLLGKSSKYHLGYDAAVVKHSHPYISGTTYYNTEDCNISRGGVNRYPWTTSLCLSSWSDGIINALDKNDYKSFVMNIGNWNNIYNNVSTNPHNAPSQIYYQIGIPKNTSEEDIQMYKNVLSFSKDDCFRSNLSKHMRIEDMPGLRHLNDNLDDNYYEYSDYVFDECNTRECPLRGECEKYLIKKEMLEIEDFDEKLESLVGYRCEAQNQMGDFSWSANGVYFAFVNSYNYIHSRRRRNVGKYGETYFVDTLYNYGYWDKVENTPIPDSENTAMQSLVGQWTQSINSQGR